MSYDWDKVLKLLEVVHGTMGHPRLKAIRDEAMNELDTMANPPVEEPPEKPASSKLFGTSTNGDKT